MEVETSDDEELDEDDNNADFLIKLIHFLCVIYECLHFKIHHFDTFEKDSLTTTSIASLTRLASLVFADAHHLSC